MRLLVVATRIQLFDQLGVIFADDGDGQGLIGRVALPNTGAEGADGAERFGVGTLIGVAGGRAEDRGRQMRFTYGEVGRFGVELQVLGQHDIVVSVEHICQCGILGLTFEVKTGNRGPMTRG